MAAEALAWDTIIPADRVKVRVADGWIVLEGTVNHFYEKQEAEEAVDRLLGVRGVSNHIRIEPEKVPHLSTGEIRDQIEKAFSRNAEIDARSVKVYVNDSTVTLDGHVRSWAERRQANRVAWSMPGVESVVDRMQIAS